MPSQYDAETILIIDDEPMLLKLLKQRLEAWGYVVLTAGDGATGLALVNEHHPDLVLLDVVMSGLNGHQTLQAIRRNPQSNDIPIVMLSAKGDDKTIEESLRLGAACHLTKPVAPNELKEEVTLAISRHRAQCPRLNG